MHHAGDGRLVRARVEVEHAAAVGVGKDAGAGGGAEGREPAGDLAAAAHDHEGDEVGQADERVRARVPGGRDELHRLGRDPVLPQGRRDHQLDQGRRAAQRGGTRAQHGGAAGLEHLGRDVDRHVRPGLEHRADHPDGHAPLEHPLARGQGADEALQRRLGGVGEHLELDGHVGEPLGREPQPVEQAAGHAPTLGGLDVRGVRGQQVRGPVAQRRRHRAQGGVDGRAAGRAHPGRGTGGPLRGGADGGVLGGLGVIGDGSLQWC